MAPGATSILIAAGGTGGHIYPGLALADALAKLAPEAEVGFVGTKRGLEGRLVPDRGHRLDLVDMVPFTRSTLVRLPYALVKASLQARALVRHREIDVVVGMGGYASIPAVIGARLAGVPALVHESGAVAGRANQVAARLTKRVALAFEEARASFPPRTEMRVVGMPIATELADFDRRTLRPLARQALGVAEGTTMVLVNGGSQGAASLNRLALGLAERWKDRHDILVLLKAGAAHHQSVADALDGHPGAHVVELTHFIERMDYAYAAADLAVCRAGAGTVAELAVVGLPAVLVPFPHAPDDHQAANAGALVAAGGALLVRDERATPEVVGPLIEERIAAPERLTAMAVGLDRVAHPEAAAALARWTLEVAGDHV